MHPFQTQNQPSKIIITKLLDTNEDYEHPSSLEVTGGVHDLVDLGVLERVAAGQPALLGEEPGDGDGLAEGRPLVLQQGQLPVRQ